VRNSDFSVARLQGSIYEVVALYRNEVGCTFPNYCSVFYSQIGDPSVLRYISAGRMISARDIGPRLVRSFRCIPPIPMPFIAPPVARA